MIRSSLSFVAAAALLSQQAVAAPASRRGYAGCDNPETRVSFASMPPEERKAYTDAINCIHSQPSNLDPSLYPAAVNRYQDYAVVHTSRTGMVHLSGFFLTWHRYFLSLFEKDLRQTCGYEGRFPYWDFSATVDDLQTSPVFDGSEYSLSSDGAPNGTDPIALGPSLIIPHGSGGGCIKSGPFADWTATLGFIGKPHTSNGQMNEVNKFCRSSLFDQRRTPAKHDIQLQRELLDPRPQQLRRSDLYHLR